MGDEMLSSMFLSSPAVLLMHIPTYFVKVLGHGGVPGFRFQPDTFPGVAYPSCFSSLACTKGLWSPGSTWCRLQIGVRTRQRLTYWGDSVSF